MIDWIDLVHPVKSCESCLTYLWCEHAAEDYPGKVQSHRAAVDDRFKADPVRRFRIADSKLPSDGMVVAEWPLDRLLPARIAGAGWPFSFDAASTINGLSRASVTMIWGAES